MNIISQLNQLKYLDISSPNLDITADSNDFLNDTGFENIQNLNNLKWLNISGYSKINDTTIKNISDNCTKLIYLNIESCKLLTDQSLQYISSLKIINLDISNCPLFTHNGIFSLCNER
jgi:uncharacterized protein Smg (DUF494 family)